MKHLVRIVSAFIAMFLCMNATTVEAQEIGLGIALPVNEPTIDNQSSKVLVTKLQRIMSNTGISDYSSGFVVVPIASVTEDEIIEGGLKNMFKVKLDLTLEVIQLSTQKVFGSTSVELKGTGMRSKSVAFKNAMGSIRTNSPEIEQFLITTKKKILDYYETNTASIISRARGAAARNEFDEAIAILSTYPEGIKGSDEIQKELTVVFEKYRKANCEQTILQAQSAIALKNYDLAASLLSEIDPGSTCRSKADQLLNSMNREIRETEQRNRADQIRRENLAADLVKTRINAARDVAKAYYQRTYPNYTIIL